MMRRMNGEECIKQALPDNFFLQKQSGSWVAAPLSFSAFALFAITLLICHHFIHFSKFHYKQFELAVAHNVNAVP